MEFPRKIIDWAKVMRELRAEGMTPYKIAMVIGCSRCAAENWEEGGEPGYGYGAALLALHVAIVVQKRTNRSTQIAA